MAKTRLCQGFVPRLEGADLPRIMPWRASIAPETPQNPAASMTLSVTHATEQASPLRGLLPLWVGVAHLCAVSAGRQPAADRSRYDVADHRRAVDHRPPRGADNRRLFLHHARPALDLDAVAGAGALCQGLCARSAGAARWCWRRRDRGDLRAAGQIPEPAFERKHDAGVRRRGAGADGAASAGAAACAGAAGHGGVGRRHDRGGGPPRARRRSGCCR